MSEHAKTMGAIAAGAFLGFAALGGIYAACRQSDSNPESSRGAYRGREPADDNAEQSDIGAGKTITERMRDRRAAELTRQSELPPRAAKKSKKKKKKTKKKKKKIN